MDQFCPGSGAFRQFRPEISACPHCGGEVEIRSDEIKGHCASCRRMVFRDNAMGCLDWCRHGEECVGAEMYETSRRNRAVGLNPRLTEAMEKHFGGDRRRIAHAKAVLGKAEQIVALIKDAFPANASMYSFITGAAFLVVGFIVSLA